MKIARLLLQAFGPFTGKTLDFAASPANLHLIYGPNEAGKSAALRAITDLRFGIPMRSPDDFIHPTGRMRIAGVFMDDQGQPIGLIRRKGRAPTLSRFDVATEQPDPALPVLREHELALTGGVERGEFETMFGLNHERLRAGGDQLIKGEGELGSALFEASAGTRGIAAILATLDDDAKGLFNVHGRAQNATINDARRQLDEQRTAWRQAQTKPAEWQALNRAHEHQRHVRLRCSPQIERREAQRQIELIGRAVAHRLDSNPDAVRPLRAEHRFVVGFVGYQPQVTPPGHEREISGRRGHHRRLGAFAEAVQRLRQQRVRDPQARPRPDRRAESRGGRLHGLTRGSRAIRGVDSLQSTSRLFLGLSRRGLFYFPPPDLQSAPLAFAFDGNRVQAGEALAQRVVRARRRLGELLAQRRQMRVCLAFVGGPLFTLRKQVSCRNACGRTQPQEHGTLLFKFRFCLPLLLCRRCPCG